ncbi:hypothetical protein D9757_002677 [Collybiopsis confluens]|uniref:Uncharacterized protein n=1 Tax=Collybiopsis confluens TaxID=2823264 RepID=A0A8H5HW85_9AGAR|nr:hypothetical protein D9757_002677 [Collybiopsis confluens]
MSSIFSRPPSPPPRAPSPDNPLAGLTPLPIRRRSPGAIRPSTATGATSRPLRSSRSATTTSDRHSRFLGQSPLGRPSPPPSPRSSTSSSSKTLTRRRSLQFPVPPLPPPPSPLLSPIPSLPPIPLPLVSTKKTSRTGSETPTSAKSRHSPRQPPKPNP